MQHCNGVVHLSYHTVIMHCLVIPFGFFFCLPPPPPFFKLQLYVKYPHSCTNLTLPKAVSNFGFAQLTSMLLSDFFQSTEEATQTNLPCCRKKRQLLLPIFNWHRKAYLGFAVTNKTVLTEPVWISGKVSRAKTQREGLQQGRLHSAEEDPFREHLNELNISSRDLMGCTSERWGSWPMSLSSRSQWSLKGHGHQERFLMTGRM